MTPARILAICRDEWPALRWRWEGFAIARLRSGSLDCIIVSEIADNAHPWPTVGVRALVRHDGRSDRTACVPLTERGLRSVLREARRLVSL